MKSLKVILAVVIMSLGVSHLLGAQELNCSVEINTDKISAALMEITVFIHVQRIDFNTDRGKIFPCQFNCFADVRYIRHMP